MLMACKEGHLNIVQFLHDHGAAQEINSPTMAFQPRTPLTIACERNRLNIVQWLIMQGTPSKNNIAPWLNKLNTQNRTILFQQGIENRDVAHEELISFACVVRNGSARQNPVHGLDIGLILDKISNYVQGITSARSLWYAIVRQGP